MAKSKTTKTKKGRRVALHLPREVQALLIRCLAMWAAIKADPAHFTDPYPPAAEVDAQLKAFTTAIQAAEGGDPVAIAALRAEEDKLRRMFELLGKYVQTVVSKGPVEDAPAIISSVLMYESQVGQRASKAELEVRQSVMSGHVQLIARAVESALVYYWDYSSDQVSWSSVPQTAQASTSIAGLTPGKTYFFRFRAFKRDGTTTEPSQVVNLMVI